MPSAMSVADVCLSLRNLDVPSVGVEVDLGILLELCQGKQAMLAWLCLHQQVESGMTIRTDGMTRQGNPFKTGQ